MGRFDVNELDPTGWVHPVEISDDPTNFSRYAIELINKGLWPHAFDQRLRSAQAVINPDRQPYVPDVDRSLGEDGRRLLVVATWPTAFGGAAPLHPSDEWDDDYQPVFGRSYRDIWTNVRGTLKMLALSADIAGYPRQRDLIRDAAEDGLLRSEGGDAITPETVEIIMADPATQTWWDGYLLTWDDVIGLLRSLHVSFGPTTDRLGGRFSLDFDQLIAGRWRSRSGDKPETEPAHPDQPRQPPSAGEDLQFAGGDVHGHQGSIASALRTPSLIHNRITAGGLIRPPSMSSKYRRLFQALDEEFLTGAGHNVDLRIADLTLLLGPGAGDTSTDGGLQFLPESALTTPQWWYAPWNPEKPRRAVIDPQHPDHGDAVAGLKSDLEKHPHARAWAAAGLRAKPEFVGGRLQRVIFKPVADRDIWWPLRDQLRSGMYNGAQVLRDPRATNAKRRPGRQGTGPST